MVSIYKINPRAKGGVWGRGEEFFSYNHLIQVYMEKGGGGGIITRRLERCSTLTSIALLGPMKSVYKGEG